MPLLLQKDWFCFVGEVIWMTPIGEQIQKARKAKGLTQDALANALSVTRQSISNYESGRRMPDVETLMHLSQVLDCRFLEEDASAKPVDDPEAENAPAEEEQPEAAAENAAVGTAGEEEETAEPKTETESNSEPDSDPAGTTKGRRIRLIAAVAAVFLAAIVLLVWKPWQGSDSYRDENGDVYSISDFKQTAANDASKAYLKLVPSVQVMKGEKTDFWLFNVNCYETNNIPLRVERFEEFVFGEQVVTHRVFGAQDMETAGVSTKVDANGEWQYTGGFPVQAVRGIGWKITTIDANDATESFTTYLPLAYQ